MDERTREIIRFEEQVIEDRKQMLAILQQKGDMDSEAFRDKLLFLQSELQHLTYQYELMLKESGVDAVERVPQTQGTQPIPQNMQRPQGTQPMPQNMQRPQGTQPMPQNMQRPQGTQPMPQNMQRPQGTQPMPQNMQRPQGTQPMPQNMQRPQGSVTGSGTPVKQSRSIEGTIGKTLMGIFASVLIFISLILFGFVLLPYINDIGKTVISFVISFAFLTVGFIGLRKKKESMFFLSLLGCGMGAVYVSLILCNIAFHTIGDVALYLLILLWAGGVCCMSRYNSWLFHLIGQLGVMVSVIFGAAKCADTDDITKFVILLIYYVVAEVAFYLSNCKKGLAANLIFHFSHIIDSVILIFGMSYFIGLYETPGYLLIMPFAAASIFIVLLIRIRFDEVVGDSDHIYYGVMSTIYSTLLLICLALATFYLNETAMSVVLYVAAVLLFASAELSSDSDLFGSRFFQIAMAIAATIGLFTNEYLREYMVPLLIVLPLILHGFIKDRTDSKFYALGILFLYIFFEPNSWWQLLLAAGICALTIYLAQSKEEQYGGAIKIIAYLLGLLFVVVKFNEGLRQIGDVLPADWEVFLTFLLLSLINSIVMFTPIARNPKDGKDDLRYAADIINLCLLIAGMVLMDDINDVWVLPVIIVTVALSFLNTKRYYKGGVSVGKQLYLGIKYSILLIGIIGALNGENYLTSIGMILLAIGCIIFGFVKEKQALRIYGLIVTLICVIKLILFDISYSNTLAHAVGFFIAGILCFVISMIYYIIDKKMKSEMRSS